MRGNALRGFENSYRLDAKKKKNEYLSFIEQVALFAIVLLKNNDTNTARWRHFVNARYCTLEKKCLAHN